MTITEHPERLLDPRLAAIPTIAHGFFTRRGGVSDGVYASLNCGIGSGDDRDRILANRARVAASVGVAASHLVSPYQVHGSMIAVVEEPWAPGAGPEADGIVTAKVGIAIGVGTADCAPVLFADPDAGIVGAAHAGWGGAFKGVLEATLAAMVGLGARPYRVSAAIGPAIAQQSYEVGLEFRARFLADDPANDRHFRQSDRPDHFRFDLSGYVTMRLAKMELGAISTMADLDTYADEERFFSFRRTTHRGETDYGRMISTIALT